MNVVVKTDTTNVDSLQKTKRKKKIFKNLLFQHVHVLR